MSAAAQRYTIVAILLHWAIALGIAGQIALGWWMGAAIQQPATQAQAFAAIQLHKSIGLTILALSLLRLGWRLTHRVPPLPDHMPAWEKVAARATHWAFYALIIALPLSGWLYVSSGWSAFAHRAFDVPTYFFGLFNVPHLFGIEHASTSVRQAVGENAMAAHEALAWVTIALAALHVAAALKHHFVDRDGVLAQMVPGLMPRDPAIATPPADPRRRAGLIAGFAVIAIAFVALVAAWATPPHAEAPAPETTTAEATPTTTAATTSTAVASTTAPTAPQGPPPTWTVDQAQSAITFTGTFNDESFSGGFSRWSADIRFDPDNLGQSHAEVTVQASSVHTGDPQRDDAMPQTEWFDSAAHPTITFRASQFRRLGGERYEARGTLTVKGVAAPVRLPFTLHIAGDHASVRGRVQLDRVALGLGAESFPDDSVVARAVNVSVHVEATRTP